jgi:hypothetical protein
MKYVRLMVVGLMAVVVMGCATAPVIGPVSYYTSKQNKGARMRRAALMSNKLTAEQKAKVVQLAAHGTDPKDIAVGLQVDLLELIRGNYTTMEVIKQVGGVLADGGIYAILYKLAKDYDDDDDAPSNTNDGVTIDVSGNNNDVNVVNGDNNSSNNDKENDADNDSSIDQEED